MGKKCKKYIWEQCKKWDSIIMIQSNVELNLKWNVGTKFDELKNIRNDILICHLWEWKEKVSLAVPYHLGKSDFFAWIYKYMMIIHQ